MSDSKLTYTIEEAAELLGIGRNSCYEAIRTGQIPSIKIGRRILIPRHALDAFLGAPAPTPQAAAPAPEEPKVLWKPCPCCEGTGVIGVKPKSADR